MYRLIDLYNATERERNHFFLLLEQLPENVWHAQLGEKLWTPEHIFRHLLGAFIWIGNTIPGVEIESSPMGLTYGKEPEGTYTLEEIKAEFAKVSSIIRPAMEELTSEIEDEEIETEFNSSKTTRAKLIAGLLTHEHSHFGQITYIIKRFTGKTDQDLRELLFEVLKKKEED